jgi:ribonucleoside-diphosphate reductase alpha chain
MDSFATAISLALQHGVPLRVLCEKFAHTRFEPSGWTGNPEIGFAKSIMDYIFRWIQIRFLSGHQLDLFANMNPAASESPASDGVVAALDPAVPNVLSDQDIFDNGAGSPYEDRTPPQHGIAPEPSASLDPLSSRSAAEGSASSFQTADRGIYHPSDAMKSMFDMGDAPSCATCGAIMTRSGSCYRCMSCGSTSGCS